MMKVKLLTVCTLAIFALAVSVFAGNGIKLALSGEGVVNDSTIKAGQPVTVEIHFENDTTRSVFTAGFAITSPDIKTITHVKNADGSMVDSSHVKGYNGFEDKSVWDMTGLKVMEIDWDGNLPELLGFGGVAIRQGMQKQDWTKQISFDIVVPSAGTIVIDSSFYPPRNPWVFATPARAGGEPVYPDWYGPYTIKVVE